MKIHSSIEQYFMDHSSFQVYKQSLQEVMDACILAHLRDHLFKKYMHQSFKSANKTEALLPGIIREVKEYSSPVAITNLHQFIPVPGL